jgi:hypothetical protein
MLAAEHALHARGRAAGMSVERREIIADFRSKLGMFVPYGVTSGLSRSWCSSASISPFAISCERGADRALAAPSSAQRNGTYQSDPSQDGSDGQIFGAK